MINIYIKYLKTKIYFLFLFKEEHIHFNLPKEFKNFLLNPVNITFFIKIP